MANLCIVMGKSSSGKSTSIRTLDPKTTYIINTLKKPLPFKGAKSLYNVESKNLAPISDYPTLKAVLKSINEDRTHIKDLIVDDAIYFMRNEFFNRSKEKGFEKYNEIGSNFYLTLLNTLREMREDLNIYLMLHTEDVVDNGSIVSTKISTIGKLVEEKGNPIEGATVVLHAKPQIDDKGNLTYGFYTNVVYVNGVELPAKSPIGMFEDIFIPNDLKYVSDKMTEYYN